MKGITGILLGSLLAAQSAFGQVATNYNIQSNSAGATSEIVNSNQSQDKILSGFLLEKLKPILMKNPYVAGVDFAPGAVKDELGSSWTDYNSKNRVSHVFVQLSLPTRVGMMFEVTESYRVCKPPAAGAVVVYDESSGAQIGGGGDCALESDLKVRGPIAVYGSFSSAENVDALLRDKQTFRISASKSYDKKNLEVTSRLTLESNLFEKNFVKFLKIFRVQTAENFEQFVSRQVFLVGVARLERQINEELLR